MSLPVHAAYAGARGKQEHVGAQEQDKKALWEQAKSKYSKSALRWLSLYNHY